MSSTRVPAELVGTEREVSSTKTEASGLRVVMSGEGLEIVLTGESCEELRLIIDHGKVGDRVHAKEIDELFWV